MNKTIFFIPLFAIVSLLSGCMTPGDINNSKNQQLTSRTLNKDLKNSKAYTKAQEVTLSDMQYAYIVPSVQSLMNYKRPERFNIAVKGMDAPLFYTSLLQQSGYGAVVSPDVKGKISITLKDVGLQGALKALQAQYHIEATRTSYGYRVQKEKLETRMFHLNRIDLDRSGTTNMAVSGVGLAGGVKIGTTPKKGAATVQTKFSDKKFWSEFTKSIKGLIKDSKGGKVFTNQDTGIIIVKAYPEDLKNVAEFIGNTQQIDNRQVVIQAKVLEVELSRQFGTGINLDFNHYSWAGGSGTLKFLGSTKTSFSSIMKLISEQGKITVISSPRISTVNDQQALIKIGKDEYFVTDFKLQDTTAGSSVVQAQDFKMEPFFSGISLDVLPHISGTGDILLHVHPMVSTITGDPKSIVLSSSQTVVLPMASSTVRESDSIVESKSGQVIVIGGLMESRGTRSGSTIPGLDTLGIYPENADTSGVVELVILLKASVVNNNKQWAKELQSARYNYSLVNHYYDTRPNFASIGSAKQNNKTNDRELAAVNKAVGPEAN
jgi:MSHA biogenesis protein MshL